MENTHKQPPGLRTSNPQVRTLFFNNWHPAKTARTIQATHHHNPLHPTVKAATHTLPDSSSLVRFPASATNDNGVLNRTFGDQRMLSCTADSFRPSLPTNPFASVDTLDPDSPPVLPMTLPLHFHDGCSCADAATMTQLLRTGLPPKPHSVQSNVSTKASSWSSLDGSARSNTVTVSASLMNVAQHRYEEWSQCRVKSVMRDESRG